MTIEDLQAFGANTQEGVARCFGKTDFYLRLVKTVPAEPNFDKLDEAIKAGDYHTAFESAHALKGVLGNLSLTPLFDPISEMTEQLRAGEEHDYSTRVADVMAKREELRKLCQA